MITISESMNFSVGKGRKDNKKGPLIRKGGKGCQRLRDPSSSSRKELKRKFPGIPRSGGRHTISTRQQRGGGGLRGVIYKVALPEDIGDSDKYI